MPRKLQVVSSASSNQMKLDLDNFENFHKHQKLPAYEAPPSLFPSSAQKPRHNLFRQQTKDKEQSYPGENGRNHLLRENLRRQVQKNMKLIDEIHKSTDGFSPESGGPVLKVMRKQIAITTREKALDERFKFYRNKESRWAFSPKVSQEHAVEKALQERGLSPEEIKNLAQLTEASLKYSQQSKRLWSNDNKKNTNLPITQAFMTQRNQIRRPRNEIIKPLPEKNVQPYYSALNSQRSRHTNDSKNEYDEYTNEVNRRTQIYIPLQKPESPNLFGLNNTFQSSQDHNRYHNGSQTQRNSLPQMIIQPPMQLGGAHAENYFGQQSLRNKPFFSSQINQYNTAQDLHHLNPDPTTLPIFSQYLESINQNRLKTSERPRMDLLQITNKNFREPLKTAMIKYREHKHGQTQGKSPKLHDALQYFSNSALNSRIQLSLPVSPSTATGGRNTLESLASKTSSLEKRSIMTVKPFFDPSLTYRNPKDLRGVVEIKQNEPRKRIKELYQHYQKKGDYTILSRFLLRRDWLDKPSRLKELKQKIAEKGGSFSPKEQNVKSVKWKFDDQ